MSAPTAHVVVRWSDLRRQLAGFIGLLLAGVTLGTLSSVASPLAVVVAVALLVIGLAALDLGIVAVLAVPATLVMVRVGGFLSVSDVVLAGATVVGLLLLRGHGREMGPLQPLLWAGIAYQASLVPTLVLNPYHADFVEWAHELVLVIGSLVVGWAIGRRGQARAAIGLYTLGCAGIAVAAIITAVGQLGSSGSFGPVYLPYLHKNFIGNSLAVAVVFAYARPPWLRWSRSLSYTLIGLFALGIAASGARQAMISAVVGLAVVNLRGRVSDMRRSRLVWFALIPAVIFVTHAVSAQLSSGNQFNSTSQRLSWFDDSLQIWHMSPVFGVGLRWWYTDRFPVIFQPPNGEFEMLTSAGLVGTVAFLGLFMTAVWVLARMNPSYGTVALAVLLVRFTQGQLDLYWVAGQASLLWIIAGMMYGLECRHRSTAPPAAIHTSPPAPMAVGR